MIYKPYNHLIDREFSRTVSVEVIEDEDEITEYYTDEEMTNSEGIPTRTGINNSDIGSFDGDESIDSTEEDLRKISEKETRKEEEEDERNYTSDDRETKEDEDTKDDNDEMMIKMMMMIMMMMMMMKMMMTTRVGIQM